MQNTTNTLSTSQTENGDVAYSTSGSACLDCFTKIVRNAPIPTIIEKFVNAYNECPETALKILMNLRDCRNGKGEKLISQVLLLVLKIHKPMIYESILADMLNLGYYKDLLVLIEMVLHYNTHNTNKSKKVTGEFELDLFVEQLKKDIVIVEGNKFDLDLKEESKEASEANKANKASKAQSISMAAKYAPSEKQHYNKGGLEIADRFVTKLFGDSPQSKKLYRQMLTKLRARLNLIETNLSTGQFDKINFSHIPATAHRKLRAALLREINADGETSPSRIELSKRYNEYLSLLTKGDKTVKINSSGVQPHEIVSHYLAQASTPVVDETLEAQWKDILVKIANKGKFSKTMAVVDVSGSMEGQPMQVAIALGIIVASSTEGSFKNKMITFETNPSWFSIDGCETLKSQVEHVKSMPWGGSTNIESVFDLILTSATTHGLKQEQMIETLFIFTDMQFNQAANTSTWETSFQRISKKYTKAGYVVPKIICWNLRSSGADTMPFTSNETNVACLSGFSSELLKSVLDMSEFTPTTMMMHVLEPYTFSKLNTSLLQNNKLVLDEINLEIINTAVEQSKIKSSFKKKSGDVPTLDFSKIGDGCVLPQDSDDDDE